MMSKSIEIVNETWKRERNVIALINECIKIIRASVKHLKEATPFALDEVGNSLPYQYT